MGNLRKTFGKLAVPLLVLLAISFSALPAQAKYGGGTGEPNDPYLIYTAEQMNEIGLSGNWDDWDKCFILMADIDLSVFTGTAFNIIGYRVSSSDNKPFTGVFDGNGHTISNFTYGSNNTDGTGLFGYVDDPNAEIKNVGLIGPNVDAGIGSFVGSLVGYFKEGTVTACYAEGGSVSGDSRVGGLVGSNGGEISNCYSTGDVSGVGGVGGLVGYNWGTISDCYATGDVSGNNNVGGLVGSNFSGIISNCYSSGSVSGTTEIGGLVGYNYRGTITNCYSTSSIMGSSNVGGLVGSFSSYVINSYWDVETSGQDASAGGEGKATAQMMMSSTYLGWNGCGEIIWTIDEGNDYPRLLWEARPGQPLPEHQLGDFLQGSGTEIEPYLVDTAKQINMIGLFSCEWDKYFKLMADIDLAGFEGTAFNIIGTENIPFAGVFDGSGHTISNFTYTSTGTHNIGLFGYVGGLIKDLGLIDPNVDAGTGDYVGSLVGRLREGTITNCYSTGSVSGRYSVGGLVGYNDDGTITNCYSTASISGNYRVGGLVGYDWGKVTNCYSTGSVSGTTEIGGLVGYNSWHGTITNCYSTGSVTGGSSVGGLVGYNSWHGTITNCYSTASVSGDRSVGGLVGWNEKDGTISNCYSTGSTSGNWGVGGLVGDNRASFTITNCYSTGSVSGNKYVGGLVGYNYYGTVSTSFWDTETSRQATSAGGTGKTTAEMQTMSTFTDAGWDFETPVWTIDEGVDYPRLWWEFVPVLHAEPEVTPGTTNIISWDPVPGANDYYAECAADANFTSIVYSSGWIADTNCTFYDLEAGQTYWYRVKARNAVGTETGWSNVESSLQVTLAEAVDMMLDPATLKNKNMKNALLNKIDAALKMIEEGNYTGALSKLEHDILAKTNGCAETGRPDKNDWIITCEGQEQIYPLVIETIENVKGLMNQ